jgi:tetratricopeptide (TPR) repeat protein
LIKSRNIGREHSQIDARASVVVPMILFLRMQPAARGQRAVFLSTFAVAGVVLGWLAAGDVGFRDAGEIGTAAFELGVAHPTGFAVDLLLLRASWLLPLGTIALRQNLMVALEAALALATLAALCDLLVARLGVQRGIARLAASGLPSLALLGWPTFLGTARATEVYSLAFLLVVASAYGVARGGAARGVAMCVVGLGPGLHVTAALYAALLLAASSLEAGLGRAWRFVRARLAAGLACAAVVLYLPLASRRQPALDWGDPETLGRVLDHLSAARIRSAYSAAMLSGDADATLRVLEQLAELWPVLPLALLGVVLGLRKVRAVVLGPLALLAADLAYAAWVNPMGAVDRQVGHVAGAALCLLAGLGVALACDVVPTRRLRGVVLALASLPFAVPALLLTRAELADDFAASELHGSGGPLAAVPPRSVIVCSGDDDCAAGTFAVHVEAVRPDVDVVPAQHLWDQTVLRRIERSGLARVPEPPPELRAAVADAVVRRLAGASVPRPVLFVSDDPLRRAQVAGVPAPSVRAAPYLAVAGEQADFAAAVDRLDRLRTARFGSTGGPRAERARVAWSLAYDALGAALIGRDLPAAVRALRSAASIAPHRVTAWVNLGVALERSGRFDEAKRCARRALKLDPSRPTPWVNLARLELRVSGPAAAGRVLTLAHQAGVRDPRLDALARELSP